MKNEKIFRLVFLVIAFIIYSALVFSGLFTMRSSFLASYVFSIIAFVYILSMWLLERDNTGKLSGSKLSITPKSLGILYLIVSIIQSIAAGVAADFSVVAVVVINLVIISLVIGITVAIFQKKEDESEETKEPKLSAPTSDGKLLQQLRSEINRIADSQENLEVKRRLQRIAERLRIAKHISEEEIDQIDRSMIGQVEKYKAEPEIGALINAMDASLDERKRLEQKYQN